LTGIAGKGRGRSSSELQLCSRCCAQGWPQAKTNGPAAGGTFAAEHGVSSREQQQGKLTLWFQPA